ncbi:uncharacterized protein KGF55_002375 [Candida pseudojiufengensis]|uniref:uncharacterized protein n=1 Tax=Candida pseudojiufengensis TaxID=497109 RepID=UPI0022241A96|nr:uncharacterized protein KGF55_002375 [Candida pseudojiufengensis]KAI5963495.1 hypothetical protein KGF55_002375 [Candida pseudojiufengensis]
MKEKGISKLIKYFKSTIEFRCKITPPPKSSSELNFIIENFEKLGTIEYLVNTTLNDVSIIENDGFWLKIIFNPILKRSRFGPILSEEEMPTLDKKSDLVSKTIKSKFINNLYNLIAIPRYLYLKNDNPGFFTNTNHLKFVYDLSSKGSIFYNKFKLSNSSIEHPFITIIESDPTINKFKLRASIRHNYQYFHKIDNIEIIDDARRILQNLQEPLDKNK